MEVKALAISGPLLLRPEVYTDERGYFFESYNDKSFKDIGIYEKFVQDNRSGSKFNTLRGLHYQIRQPQGKLISVLQGEIFDVAVDLRKSSRSFGSWIGMKLSSEGHERLWIPVGFAHGFLVLSEWADVMYKVTDYYAPDWERTLMWNDPEIGIEWPLHDGERPFLSAKDAQGVTLDQADLFD